VNGDRTIVVAKLQPLSLEAAEELLDVVARKNTLDTKPVVNLVLLNRSIGKASSGGVGRQ
jgi:hypothetical protein